MKPSTIILLLLFTAPVMAKNDTIELATGNDFLNTCNLKLPIKNSNAIESVNALRCTSYMQGFMYGYDAAIESAGEILDAEKPSGVPGSWDDFLKKNYKSKDKINQICTRYGVTIGQIIRVTHAYITSNPKIAHRPLPGLIESALVNAFPCGEGVKK